jgi:23S rRNA (adenine-N6)-dimethyltransferase
VSARRPRTERDRRRRTLGQNFLVDTRLAERFVADLGLDSDDLVVEIGAGDGRLTLPLARTGAAVWAVEPDPVWADRLHRRVAESGHAGHVRVIGTTFDRARLPDRPYRAVGNLPFGATTAIVDRLLDVTARPPTRADLIVQREVADKHATSPPVALRTAAWLPWWHFERGMTIPAGAFRPRPSVDAAVLSVSRRHPALLPERLARGYADALRPAWDAASRPRPRR